MRNLKTILRTRLKGACRVALLGVGSELRGDDAAGIRVCAEVAAVLKERRVRTARVFYGHTAPENVTGEIRKYAPSHVIIVDAADFGRAPGTVSIVDLSLSGGTSCSTHRLPVAVFAAYLEQSIKCVPILIGIQPSCLTFGAGVSSAVNRAVRTVSTALSDSIPVCEKSR